MSGGETEETEAILVAVHHKIRREILRQLGNSKSRTRRSPREMADQMRQSLSNVSYHVRVLSKCGLIQLVDTQPVRGSVQHFYETTNLVDHPVIQASLGSGD